MGAFKVPMKVKVTLFDSNLSVFEPTNRVITWNAVDLFKYTRTGRIISDGVSSKVKLVDKEFKATVNDLAVEIWVNILSRLLSLLINGVIAANTKLVGNLISLLNKLLAVFL